MEKKESIKEYLQKMLDRWNKYDVLDGFVAENFRVDLEKTLEYWDLRIADNKEELDKAREEELQNIFPREEWGVMYESLIYRFGNDKEFKHLEQKILGMRKLSKLKDNK